MSSGFRVLLFLLLFLLPLQWVCGNDSPCQRSRWNNGYDTFLRRHVRSGTPASSDVDAWKSYIKTHGGCDRPTQSFLRSGDVDRIRAVCSSAGGQILRGNLCISRQPFSFVTVRSQPETCSIRSITQENKHLILACERLENQCLPVHFEGNPENLRPDNNARGCQDPESSGNAADRKSSNIWIIPVLLMLLYAL